MGLASDSEVVSIFSRYLIADSTIAPLNRAAAAIVGLEVTELRSGLEG